MSCIKKAVQWVPDKVNSHGLVFNPAFLRAINQLSQLSDILFTDGSQGISFELQARPAPEVVETQLTIDGQKLRYFNQMADWQTFRWPGETYKPGTLLTWTTVNAGTRLFGDYSGTWGFIRWLEQGKTPSAGSQPVDDELLRSGWPHPAVGIALPAWERPAGASDAARIDPAGSDFHCRCG
ncbi:type VI secretion protein VasK [Klebsiella pneumoniae subsp. ozaenae]|uniref:Type VI secretion protein VasK n=1 Tax=Klebsiella pneumoniae subsp. ozaenae TaxID=574 RepID=A0A377ZVC9_KLEPO|nr:type VI secretion protein VasK [Klebsiella pneumoniae subsp. ozaenae]